MHAPWLREFGIALAVFAVPMAVAARLAYVRIRKSILGRESARRTIRADHLRRLLEEREPQAPAAPAGLSSDSRRESIQLR